MKLLLLSLLFLGASFGTTLAQHDLPGKDEYCFTVNYRSYGDREELIKQLLRWSNCIRNRDRYVVGKWLCDVTGVAAQSNQQDGSIISRKAVDGHATFVATIVELFSKRDDVREWICKKEFGVTENFEVGSNHCLMNFMLRLSSPVSGGAFRLSQNGRSFSGDRSFFSLNEKSEFLLVDNEMHEKDGYLVDHGATMYVGKCKKVGDPEE